LITRAANHDAVEPLQQEPAAAKASSFPCSHLPIYADGKKKKKEIKRRLRAGRSEDKEKKRKLRKKTNGKERKKIAKEELHGLQKKEKSKTRADRSKVVNSPRVQKSLPGVWEEKKKKRKEIGLGPN
jgi:hypothetical protein